MTHRETVQRGQSAQQQPTERALQAVLAKAEDDFGSDDEFEQAENDALAAVGRSTPNSPPSNDR